MNDVDHFPLPIPEDDLPPIPSTGEKGPHVCDIIQLYLGILAELPPEQARLVLEHVRTCNDCTAVQRQMEQATWLLAGLPASIPSERIDHAVMDAHKGNSVTSAGDHYVVRHRHIRPILVEGVDPLQILRKRQLRVCLPDHQVAVDQDV